VIEEVVRMQKNGFVPGGVLRLCKGPWAALATAALVLLITFALQQLVSLSVIPLIFVGLIAAAVGVAVRPGDYLVLLAAGGCALLGALSLLPEWDSLRMLLFVLAGIAVLCAAIVPLPRILRRLAFSLLILFHFAGISCAVLNVNPSPWLTAYAWAHCFQYYLNFIYMNNAYHFYAPEPGPGIMIWFDVHYDDLSEQWMELPVRENHHWLLNYQRRLSLPEQINQTVNNQPPSDQAIRARALAGNRDGIPFYYGGLIPDAAEYRPPTSSTKMMLESYARHVGHSMPHPTDPNRKITGIKVYRVVHRMMSPKETSLGLSPEKKWFFQPFFQGEYDADGNLKNPEDPYLYWLIPLVNKNNPRLSSGEMVELDTKAALHQDEHILDCMEIHTRLPTILPASDPAERLGGAAIPGKDVPQSPK
jgi:hypothetical protein